MKESLAMSEWILKTCYQIHESLSKDGLRHLIRKRVFWQRTATPVEMDLSTLPASGGLKDSDYQFIELTQEDLRTGKWSFAVPSRRFKAPGNLRKGWRGFALARDSIVVGDVWCITPREGGKSITHPDLDMLGIRCGEGEATCLICSSIPPTGGKTWQFLSSVIFSGL
jgi:hypothetical protein